MSPTYSLDLRIHELSLAAALPSLEVLALAILAGLNVVAFAVAALAIMSK
jgi:hypothetical protein